MSDSDADIVVRELTVTYRSESRVARALDGVSLSVQAGEMCCIVGPSGCGKSTLLKAMLGLVPHESGTITLRASRVEAGIAYVQQEAPLLPWRTVMQNACLGAEIRRNLNDTVVERVRGTLTEVGLSGDENSWISELSGGMRQRVAIARALEGRPAMLFCDEPFAAVDFVGRLALSSKFKYLCRVRGISTVFVTHNIEEAIFLGDSVIVMNGPPGRISAVYAPRLSVGGDDAVRCRASPEFVPLFESIWRDLEAAHV